MFYGRQIIPRGASKVRYGSEAQRPLHSSRSALAFDNSDDTEPGPATTHPWVLLLFFTIAFYFFLLELLIFLLDWKPGPWIALLVMLVIPLFILSLFGLAALVRSQRRHLREGPEYTPLLGDAQKKEIYLGNEGEVC